MPVKEKKTKAQIAAAAAAGARSKKKKWATSKKQEKAQTAVTFTPESYQKAVKDLAKMKVLTPYLVSERCRVNLSLARSLLSDLANEGKIQLVSGLVSSRIYAPA